MPRIFSCPAMGQMVNLSKDAIYHCCFPQFTIPVPKVIDFSDGGNGKFPFDVYKKSSLDLLNENQGESAPCAGCWQFRLFNKSVNIGALKYVALNTYSKCNSDCVYCNDSRFDSFYDTFAVIKNMLAIGAMDRSTIVDWCGGEPLISPEFAAMVPFFAENKINQGVYSNGIKYSDVLLNGLKDNTISCLVVSLDSGTRETMAKVKRRDCFTDVWNNLRRYSEVWDQSVRAKYIFMEMNSSPYEVESFIRLCKESGIKNIDIAVEVNEVVHGEFGQVQAAAAAMCIDMAIAEGITPQIWANRAFPDICLVPRDARELIMSYASHRLPVLGI